MSCLKCVILFRNSLTDFTSLWGGMCISIFPKYAI